MHGGGRVGTMRKDAQAGVRDWEGPPALGGGWERRNWPARDSSLGLTQLKSQGEAGRLPQTQLLPFNTTPSPSGAPGKEWLGGQGGDVEPRTVILLPFGFGYKKTSTFLMSSRLSLKYNHIWNQVLVSLICKFVQMTCNFFFFNLSTLAFFLF